MRGKSIYFGRYSGQKVHCNKMPGNKQTSLVWCENKLLSQSTQICDVIRCVGTSDYDETNKTPVWQNMCNIKCHKYMYTNQFCENNWH